MRKEALRWIHENKGLEIAPEVDRKKDYYGSPRISSELPDCSMPMTFDSYSFCSLGCTFCVTGDTRISTPGNGQSIAIKSLRVGDIVLAKDIKCGKVEEDKVTAVMQRETDDLICIHLENGASIETTPEHPVFVLGVGWKDAGELMVHESILYKEDISEEAGLYSNLPVKITKIEEIPGKHQVYNIEVGKNNNYFANGVLVHNCFAYFFKSNNPAIKNLQLRPVDVDRMIKALNGNCSDKHSKLLYDHFYSKKFLLHWGGMADPFCHFEKTNRRGLPLMKELGRLNYPTLFSFKGPTIFDKDYVKVFDKYSGQSNFAFQCSIITANEKLSAQIEVGVPTPTKRIEALKMLSDMGYWTILRLRPFIIGVSDDRLDELLERCLAAGIKGISTEFFALDCRSNEGMKTRYAAIAKVVGVPDLLKYYSKLSPSERGGYMRLNRMVKERHVRKMYEFCVKHKLVFACSDPDFKELNMSGSCCGMPDDFPANRGLENWTKSQLTYHMKEARLAYHRTGERMVLRFNEVYGRETYLDEGAFANDHVGACGKCTAERQQLTQRTIVQQQWNNLRSPACPRNYFHGKVMPCGTDSDGNLEFIYTPMEYEARWAGEGVDLTTR